MNHSISTTAGLVTAAAITSVLLTATPAQARPTCTDGSVRCAAVVAAISRYAEPIDALGGRSLAQYLAAHTEARLAR